MAIELLRSQAEALGHFTALIESHGGQVLRDTGDGLKAAPGDITERPAQLSAVADAFEAAAAAEAATFRDQARDELRAQAAHISDPAARAFSPRRGTCCACRSADRRRPCT